jgi:hypothetical protein
MGTMMNKLIVLLAFCSGLAHAEFKDGNELFQLLTSRDTLDRVDALGYVTGVADALRGTIHCISANATAGQISDMTLAYLRRNPENRHLPADVIIAVVLKNTWPCKKGGQSL